MSGSWICPHWVWKTGRVRQCTKIGISDLFDDAEIKGTRTNLDNGIRNQVPDTQVLLQEQPDLSRADVVLDDLADHPNVVLILSEGGEGLVDIRPGALDDESAVLAEYRIEILWCPKPRLT